MSKGFGDRLHHTGAAVGADLQLHSLLEATRDTAIILSERDEAREIQLSLLPGWHAQHAACEVASTDSALSLKLVAISRTSSSYRTGKSDLCRRCCRQRIAGGHVWRAGDGHAARYTQTGQDTGSALSASERKIVQRPVAGRYAATLYAVFDPNSLQLSFANAGLPYPLLVSACGCRPGPEDCPQACCRVRATMPIACSWRRETRCCSPLTGCTICATQAETIFPGTSCEKSGSNATADQRRNLSISCSMRLPAFKQRAPGRRHYRRGIESRRTLNQPATFPLLNL